MPVAERVAGYAELRAHLGTGYSDDAERAQARVRERVRALASRLNEQLTDVSLYAANPLEAIAPADRADFAAIADVRAVHDALEPITCRSGVRPHASLEHWYAVLRRAGVATALARVQRLHAAPPTSAAPRACEHYDAPVLRVLVQVDLESRDAKVRLQLVFRELDGLLCLGAFHYGPNRMLGLPSE